MNLKSILDNQTLENIQIMRSPTIQESISSIKSKFKLTEAELSLLLNVSEEELESIQLLTKPLNEDYFEYIKRVAKNSDARQVKKADLTHNMDLSRLLQITDKDRKRREKYLKAYNLLTEYEKQIERR